MMSSPPPAAKAYWWEELVDEPLIHGLIRDIEVAKAALAVHRAECEGRNQALEQRLKTVHLDISGVKSDVSAVKVMLETMAKQNQAAAWSVNWKAWALAAFIITGLLGGLAWTGGQLYALEPLRVQHDTEKK